MQHSSHPLAALATVSFIALIAATIMPSTPTIAAARFATDRYASSAPVRIMPLGDSITQGNGAWGPTYRDLLAAKLTAANIPFDFVGSHTALGGGNYWRNDFDQDHEGHNGYRIDQATSYLTGWMTPTQPDILLVHLGHNDLIQGETITSAINDLGVLVDTARAVNPNITVLVARPIPCLPGANFCEAPQLTLLAAAIPGFAAAKTTVASPVIDVDMTTGFSINDNLIDGLHPNASGDEILAQRWFDALAPRLSTPTPTPTSTPLATAAPSASPTATLLPVTTVTTTPTHTPQPTMTHVPMTATPIATTAVITMPAPTLTPTPSATLQVKEPTSPSASRRLMFPMMLSVGGTEYVASVRP
jgi:lysophospholipase L1-like esterase